MAEIEEAELTSAGLRGTVIDGGEQAVSAVLLRKLCHEFKDRIDPRGLRLTSAIVVGGLDLTGLVVPFPLPVRRLRIRLRAGGRGHPGCSSFH